LPPTANVDGGRSPGCGRCAATAAPFTVLAYRSRRYPQSPAWSTTGRIAFVEVPSGGGDAWIAICDQDGRHLRRLRGPGHSPAWSPDGQQLAFIRPRESPAEYVTMLWGPIMVASADGRDAHRLGDEKIGGSVVAYSPTARSSRLATEGS
jgi:Tol biopolymer transport system component